MRQDFEQVFGLLGFISIFVFLFFLVISGANEYSKEIETTYTSENKQVIAEDVLKSKLANGVTIIKIEKYGGVGDLQTGKLDPLERTKIYFSDGSDIVLTKVQFNTNAGTLQKFRLELDTPVKVLKN